ncbi:MAG: dephospho-CoA kinase [Gammaproteobacteria bacterium]|nr:dephospho-CoA kinase [Gammaproteobacteria bacterium]
MLAPNQPFTVALTGGIASGKTFISDEFARLGVPIIDTDVIAHQIVEPGQPALKEIEDTFGIDVIDATGRLKRAHLRSLIFSDLNSRRKLESILHPKIRQIAMKATSEVTGNYSILVIPLLTERGAYPNISRVLVVDVTTETQISRLMTRDRCSREEAQQVLAAQASREQRLRIADDVLDNSGSLQQTRDAVALLNTKYVYLATHQRASSLSGQLKV